MFSNGGSSSGLTDASTASVYQRVLGADFGALDPRLRTYFGVIPRGRHGVGDGEFDTAGLRMRVLRPVFAVLSRWGIAFAEHGTEVPFSVRNVATVDGALRAVRTFRFAGVTREMVDELRIIDDRLIDRIGARGQVEVELAVRVEVGELRMESRRLALRVGGVRVPLPRIATVELREAAAATPEGAQRVELRVLVSLVGEVYGYRGTFTYGLESEV